MTALELLPDVRNYLDITWADADGDKKLIGIISRGMANVQRLTARTLGFVEGTDERALLFEYCRYARAGALDEFTRNYQADIITFRTDEWVKHEQSLIPDFSAQINDAGDLIIIASGNAPPLHIDDTGDLIVTVEGDDTHLSINADGDLIFTN